MNSILNQLCLPLFIFIFTGVNTNSRWKLLLFLIRHVRSRSVVGSFLAALPGPRIETITNIPLRQIMTFDRVYPPGINISCTPAETPAAAR